MKAKYKVGIEKCDYIAVCKIDGNELMVNSKHYIGLKQYLKKLNQPYTDVLEFFDIIPNPYKNTPSCSCKICEKSYKDPENKSGQLTLHITKIHNITIEEYLEQFPDQHHLFDMQLRYLNKDKDLNESDDNHIVCPLCNKKMKAVKYSHTMAVHGMTLKEFREATGMQNLLSKKSLDRAREVYYSSSIQHYVKPKTKPPKEVKRKPRKPLKEFVPNVDYITFPLEVLNQEGKHFIYKLTSPSGKCYIGRTNDFYHRMASHKYTANIKTNKDEAAKNKKIYSAINKYGWDNFSKEIIDIADNKEDAIDKEYKWIVFFDSFRNGYNSTDKTAGGVNWEGRKDTPEFKKFVERLKESNKENYERFKNRVISEEMRARMRESAKGVLSLPWYIEKYGEDVGRLKYKERSDRQRDNIAKRGKDSKGRFI